MDDQPQDPTSPQDPAPPPPDPSPSSPNPIVPPPDPTIPPGPPLPPDPVLASPRPRGRRVLVAVVAAVVLVLGAGAAAAFFMMRGSSEQLTGLVPADADVFATVYLDPSAGQKVNLLTLAARFPKLGEGADLDQRVNDLLDEALANTGLTHEDIRSWLGSEVGVSVDIADDGTPHTAGLIATTDAEASRAAIEKLADTTFTTSDYDGVAISTSPDGGAYAIVDDVVILASDETTVRRSIDAAHGTTPDLGSSQVYTDTLAGLPAGKLGVAYVNVQGLVDQFGSETAASAAVGAGGFGNLDAIESVGVSLSAESDGIALDFTTNFDPTKLTKEERDVLAAPDHDNTTLAFVPADAFGVVAGEHLDSAFQGMLNTIEQQTPDATDAIDQAGIRDLIAAMTGDLAVEVGPGTDGPVSGAVLLGTDDEAGMQTFLDSVGALVSQQLAQLGSTAVPDDLLSQMEACHGTPKQIARCQQHIIDSVDLGGTQPASPLVTEEYQGVTISSFDVPELRSAGFQPAYAVVDGAGVLATSPQEIHQLIDTKASGSDIRSSPVFTSATAKVPTAEGLYFLDVQAIADTIRQNLPPEEQAAYDRDVAPNLAPISAFVVGSESDEQHQTVRMFLQITGGSSASS
jgi:hypothetical protein